MAASSRFGFTPRSRYSASWRRRNRISASNDSRGRSKSPHHWSRSQARRTITVLDTAPLTVTPGSAYNLRLEAIGNSLRAYVNGNLLVEASDTTHKSGKYGLVMYSAKTTYEDFTAWEP